LKSLGKSPSVVALLLVLIFIVSAFPVSAIDRIGGQFWTYNASMQVAGLNATGTIMYSLSGQDSINAGGNSYDADILTISGDLHASSALFGVPYSVSSVLGGKVCEVRGEMSTITEDLLKLTNISIGLAPTQLLARMQEETIRTYTPPLLSKFDPATTGPGDTWAEALSLNTTIILNGTTQSSISRLTTYSVVIAPSMEEVLVDAGTFQTLKITVTDNTGARDVYWWSSEVQNFVVEKKYDASSSQPSTILSLKEFDSSVGDGTLVAIMAGVVVIAVAAVILAVILNARRKREPIPPLPEGAGVRKPSQMPPPTSPGVKAPGLIEKPPKH
jgi:hypothetical protein